MTPEIYWIPDLPAGRLAVMPRPRGCDWLVDEIAGWRREGIQTVLSLLERHEVRELGLGDEEALCRGAEIEFISCPIQDRGVPASARDIARLVETLSAKLGRGEILAIHCRAGIGRSALVAACVMARLGVPERDIFPRISRARGIPVPDTQAQERWLSAFVSGVIRGPSRGFARTRVQ